LHFSFTTDVGKVRITWVGSSARVGSDEQEIDELIVRLGECRREREFPSHIVESGIQCTSHPEISDDAEDDE
jgi:hypothetical protein